VCVCVCVCVRVCACVRARVRVLHTVGPADEERRLARAELPRALHDLDDVWSTPIVAVVVVVVAVATALITTTYPRPLRLNIS
jgi:hypothetical protein